MRLVECRVCGDRVGRGPSGLGIKQHSKMHKRQYRRLTGEWPDSYDEVREFFNKDCRQLSIHEAAADEDQTTLSGFAQL